MTMTTDVLTWPVLWLNRGWTPIRVSSAKDAISLVCKGSAKIVEPKTYETHDFDSWATMRATENEPHISTIKLRIRVPEIIVLTVYAGTPEREIVFSRRNIFKRDRYTCVYCGKQAGTENLTLDHVVPRSKGGISSWENTVLACVDCNKRKADRTPEQAKMTLRRRPIKPRWSPALVVSLGHRRESWEAFVNRAYWNVPLEP